MGIISGFIKFVGALVLLMIVIGVIAVAKGEPDKTVEHDFAEGQANAKSYAVSSGVEASTWATDGQVEVVSDACCKHCKKGKACGDSCIAVWKTCTRGEGCACD